MMEQTRWIVQGPSDFCARASSDTTLTDIVNSGTGTSRNTQHHKNGGARVTQSTHQQHVEQVQLQPQPQHRLPRYPPEMYSSAYAPPRPVPNARYAMAPPAFNPRGAEDPQPAMMPMHTPPPAANPPQQPFQPHPFPIHPHAYGGYAPPPQYMNVTPHVPSMQVGLAPVVAQQTYPNVAASYDHHVGGSNQGFVHDPSVGSSGGSAVQQGKRRAVDAVDVQQNKRQRRLPPKDDPNFREVHIDGKLKYECQVPACGGAVLEAGSVRKHRELKTHQPDIAPVLCDLCNAALTRGDAVARHRGSARCLANQAKLQNAIASSSSATSTLMAPPTVTVPEGPFTFRVPGPAMSSVPQQTPHISPAAQFTTPGPSSVTQRAPPLPVIWHTAQFATQQSSRPGPSSVNQQALHMSPAAQFTAPGPSSVTQRAPSMPVIWHTAQSATQQALRPGPSSVNQQAPHISPAAQFTVQQSPRPGPSSVTQQAPPLPVICHDISLLPAQQSAAVLPSPVTAQDFSIPSAEEDDTDLFGSPAASPSPELPPAPVVDVDDFAASLEAELSNPSSDPSVSDDWYKLFENDSPIIDANDTGACLDAEFASLANSSSDPVFESWFQAFENGCLSGDPALQN